MTAIVRPLFWMTLGIALAASLPAFGAAPPMPPTSADVRALAAALARQAAAQERIATSEAREAAALARQAAAQQAFAAEQARVKNLPTDFPPGSGGGVMGPGMYGATCEASRARLRSSGTMWPPCAPDAPLGKLWSEPW